MLYQAVDQESQVAWSCDSNSASQAGSLASWTTGSKGAI